MIIRKEKVNGWTIDWVDHAVEFDGEIVRLRGNMFKIAVSIIVNKRVDHNELKEFIMGPPVAGVFETHSMRQSIFQMHKKFKNEFFRTEGSGHHNNKVYVLKEEYGG